MFKKLRITVEGKAYEVTVEMLEDGGVSVSAPAPAAVTAAASAPAASAPAAAPAGGNEVPSPLAGKVVSIDVKVGDRVNEGDKIITLEAMKMNTVVSAPFAGTVSAINVKAGDSVEEGEALLVLA